MGYSQDMKTSARRHLTAAQTLHAQTGAGLQPGCSAVAGYLFGLAGELAVKQMMRDSGIKPLPASERWEDPFYAHFPKLKSLLATAYGRRAGELRKIADDSKLFHDWDTEMRYAPTKDITATWVTAWKSSAEQLLEKMETV